MRPSTALVRPAVGGKVSQWKSQTLEIAPMRRRGKPTYQEQLNTPNLKQLFTFTYKFMLLL